GEWQSLRRVSGLERVGLRRAELTVVSSARKIQRCAPCASPPLRPAARAFSRSLAKLPGLFCFPWLCPPLLAISRCISGCMEAKPRFDLPLPVLLLTPLPLLPVLLAPPPLLALRLSDLLYWLCPSGLLFGTLGSSSWLLASCRKSS